MLLLLLSFALTARHTWCVLAVPGGVWQEVEGVVLSGPKNGSQVGLKNRWELGGWPINLETRLDWEFIKNEYIDNYWWMKHNFWWMKHNFY